MEIYWLLRLPHLHDLFQFLSLALLIAGVIIVVICSAAASSYLDDDELEMKNKLLRISLWMIILSPIIAIANCFVPSKTDLAIMMGWDAVKSENVQEVIEIMKDKLK